MASTRTSSIPRWVWVLCFIVVSVVVVLLEPVGDDEPAGPGGSTVENPSEALEALAALPVRPAESQSGYDRSLFGSAWTDEVTVDLGRNGCDTRNDILQRDLVDVSFEPGKKQCTVTAGTLEDPYTGKTISFRRGVETSAAVQIDHVVALSDAWKKGARHLDDQQKRNLANDPRNLIAVDGPTNQGKGDSDASEWLPPNTAFHCEYVVRQIEVKTAYELWVTQAEHDAMSRILSSC